MSRYKKDLDEMTWSYSRVNMYEKCPYSFYCRYIERNHGESNFYAENGKAVHLVHEKFFNNEITLDDLVPLYLDEFENITSNTKKETMDKTQDLCIDYFCENDFEELKEYNILGVEKETAMKVGKFNFIGYIDLLLQNKNTGEIIIVDHKSSGYPLKKNGVEVLKNHAKDFSSYKHQMYLYCKWVKENYSEFPKRIVWNHFKDKKVCVIDFSQEEYDESIKWFLDTLKKIYKDEKFLENTKEYMQCNVLCNFRYECPYKGGE